MSYYIFSFLAISIFALIHIWAAKISCFNKIIQARFLSASGGVAISYVFIDILPKLGESDRLVRQTLAGVFPYFERHVYVLALSGFLLFLIVDRTQFFLKKEGSLYLSLLSYALFNFLVGYAIVDKNNPEVRPLILFTIAIALHYFINDYSLYKVHGSQYKNNNKWVLIVSLFIGWIAGFWATLSKTSIALVSAFIGGGVIMNVTRHELSKENLHNLGAFLLAAFFYTAILLSIG